MTQIKVVNVEVPVQEWNYQRVVTYEDIAKVHNMNQASVRKAFSRHQDEFFEGEDYYSLTGKEAENFWHLKYNDHNIKRTGAKLFTKSGYCLLACLFQGKEAAVVRRTLVNSYFNERRKSSSIKALEDAIKKQSDLLDDLQKKIQLVTQKIVRK